MNAPLPDARGTAWSRPLLEAGLPRPRSVAAKLTAADSSTSSRDRLWPRQTTGRGIRRWVGSSADFAARCTILMLGWAIVSAGLSVSLATRAEAQPAVTGAYPALPEALAPAREHFQRGRYAEALETLETLPGEETGSPAGLLLRADCLAEQGELQAARELLAPGGTLPEQPDLLARYADFQLSVGDLAGCGQTLERALTLAPGHPVARVVQVEWLLATGATERAVAASKWFIDYYNKAQPDDAATLTLVARGVRLYALANPKSRNLDMIINTLCPDARKADASWWQAHALAGGLLLDKYNRAQGLPELKKALAINPEAAAVYARLAASSLAEHDTTETQQHLDRALQINPHHLDALLTQCDLQIDANDLAAARETLERVEQLAPNAEGVLARQAVIALRTDGLPSPADMERWLQAEAAEQAGDTPFARLLWRVRQVNPQPALFLQHIGESFESRFQFEFAEVCYRAAANAQPGLPGARSALGLLSMRVGKLDDARRILDEAFDSDPFHVRVSNMRKVVKLLEGYETLETPHFIVRFDSESDRVLARHIAARLEEEYPALVAQYRYEPTTKTQFEIYQRAKGVSAHQWFSARLVGLPWIQTIGASTGHIVALSSPNSGQQAYNWVRVIRHEFVHVLTLQGTRFNIPHWYTEALAVLSERNPRPESWDSLLRERVPAGRLLNLDTLNQGFTRARNQADWTFAYCQSRLYAEYLQERFGPDATSRLLEAYRRGETTAEGLKREFGVEQAEFEQGYRSHLDTVVGELQGEVADEPATSLPAAEKAWRAEPANLTRKGDYALALLNVNKRKEARQVANEIMKEQPKHPVASLVLARLALRAEETERALELLDAALDRNSPHPRVLEDLALLRLKNRDFAASAELFELGLKRAPKHVDWHKGLATALLRLKDRDRLKGVLETLAVLDGDDAVIRRKRAELAAEDNDQATAEKYARLALEIDVMNGETHQLLARACAAQGKRPEAVEAWRDAVACQPKEGGLVLELARAQRDAGDRDGARATLEKLPPDNPQSEQARLLRQELERP
jgi:tetratricopeptide (TPR) repeat protein